MPLLLCLGGIFVDLLIVCLETALRRDDSHMADSRPLHLSATHRLSKPRKKLPDVTESQDYPPFSSYGHDSPHNYASLAGYGVESDTDSDFEPISEDSTFEKDAAKAVHEMKVIYQDFCTRQDRTQVDNKYWAEQMDDIVLAYMDYCWCEKNGAPLPQTRGPDMLLEIVDIFGISSKAIPRSTNQYQSASLVQSGIIPVAPLSHTFGFCHEPTPHSLVPYLDLSVIILGPALPFEQSTSITSYLYTAHALPYLSAQLSAAFDLYVAILNAEDDKLDVRMIVTMDGNDSLQRVEQKEDALQDVEKDGETLPQTSRERLDHRVGGRDYFASRSETTAWDEANWPHTDGLPAADSPAAHVWEEGRCEDWWENMKDTNTVRSAAKFFEHGRYQYPLCLLSIFLGVEKAERERRGKQKPNGRLAVVYDIMCKFSKTVHQSPLNSLAIWEMFLPVIGTMHGYAHEQACQLVFLMLYIVGVGLEDGEGFHFPPFKHLVCSRMQESGISSPEVFYTWLVEEGKYLRNLCKTPPKETIEMEYFTKLDALQSCQRRLAEVHKAWIPYSATTRDKTNTLETKHRNEQENERKLIADVQALEESLEISSRWIEDSEQWLKAKKMVGYKMRKHIAKAMKTRSKSIQAAIKAYNEAAAALRPPRCIIQWEEVLDLIFLSEFDLLHDSREDIRE
ncbi:hypothetical protein GG344DRAFT_70767 [Lentinula edodes]|nr:hypothetical protein GG344DRAFT_70767 [Lentinula edodes]